MDLQDHGQHKVAETHHPSPTERLFQMLKGDRMDIVALFFYTILMGILMLAVPLTAQFAVNTIAAGVYMQPLVVLAIAVFLALTFVGVLRLMKLVMIERLQQRVFARVALQLSEMLPRIRHSALVDEYAPQLVNRFFDVITIQKALSKLLLDGPTAMLQVLLGLLLMALYSPYLLAFDIFLLLFVAFVITVLGIGGLRTSIYESYQKYHVANWLEELARCHRSFKINGTAAFAIEKADDLVLEYVSARRKHFRVLFRQALGNYLFRAIATTGTLAIGGALVINQQMTLGQLVAAELVIVGVLEGLEKLIRLIETGYDLLTAVDKVGHITDLQVERATGKPLPGNPNGAHIICRNVRFAYRHELEILSDLNLVLQPGERVSLVGESGAGKSTLASLLCGLLEPSIGVIQINGMDIRGANLESLRSAVALVGDSNEIFEGTIEENILMGRDHLPVEDVQWALEVAQLSEELSRLPDGLHTVLVSEGRNLSRGQIQRLLIARAIVARPQLLILDEAFTGIDENDKLMILNSLYEPAQKWTVIDISHDPEVVMFSDTIHVLANGQIVESSAPKEITRWTNTRFNSLFPTLSRQKLMVE